MKSKVSYVIILLTLVILGLTGYIVYDKCFKNEENTSKYETCDDVKCPSCDDTCQKEIIPINDKYQLAIESKNQDDYSLKVFVLDDSGDLYYKIFDSIKQTLEGTDYYYTYDLETVKDKLTKYENISNIKRIKSTNTISTGVDFNLLLITNDGIVYDLVYDSQTQKLNSYVNKDFKNYKIDDIITYEPASGCIGDEPCLASFKIKLQDGSVVNQ